MISVISSRLLALALVASAPLSAQCVGARLFFDDAWSNRSFTVDGMQPQFATPFGADFQIACTTDTSGIPAIFGMDCQVGCRELKFTMKPRGALHENGSVGFVLGYCEGDDTNPNAEYLAVIWNRAATTATLPGCGPEVTQPVGMRLVRVFGTPDPAEFWSQMDLNLPCSGPESGVEVLASAAFRPGDGWIRRFRHCVTLEVDRNRLKITVDQLVEFDLDMDMTPYLRGCFGFLAQGQSADFWGLRIAPLDPVVASSSNYGVGVAGCEGVPELRMSSRPIIGRSATLYLGNLSLMDRVCVLLASDRAENMPLPGLGGTLLVGLPLVSTTGVLVPPGGFDFDCFVGGSSCDAGTELFMQTICLDDCAPEGLSFSRGLRLLIGDV